MVCFGLEGGSLSEVTRQEVSGSQHSPDPVLLARQPTNRPSPNLSNSHLQPAPTCCPSRIWTH